MADTEPAFAALLFAGPNGGEVRRLLDVRVAYEPPVLERELLKVHRAPVNGDHNSELGQSARHAGSVALQLLFREANRNEPVARLWFDIERPSSEVTGRSAELFFGLATYLHIARNELPAEALNASFMATGVLDPQGNVAEVDLVETKVRAALAASRPAGTRLFYPRANDGQISNDLRLRCQSDDLLLCPVDRIDEALALLGAPILGAWPEGVSPFRSLEAFEASYSRVFFGRQREIAALTRVLASRERANRPGALIIGASGAGKSSFCLAGLIPTLMKSDPGIQFSVWRPRDAILGPSGHIAEERDIARSIFTQWTINDADQTGFTLPHLSEPADRLVDLLGQLPLSSSRTRIFVIDQFEEIFTLGFKYRTLLAFCQFLQSLQSSGIWVIGTLRSEFYPQYLDLVDADGNAALTPLFEPDGQYNLPRMSRDALSQVIVRPAELAGLRFEQRGDGVSLAQSLLADALETDDALPLLGFALQYLYDEATWPVVGERRDTTAARLLTFSAYEKLGGLAGSIGIVAASAFDALDPAAQEQLATLLSLLAVPSLDGGRETARPAPIEHWPAGSPGRRLIAALTDIRVLISEGNVDAARASSVRVAHEALFSNWPVAVEILGESRQRRQLVEVLRQRAKSWEGDDRDDRSLLASKRDIENGKAIMSDIPRTDENAVLLDFIDRSIKRDQRRRAVLLLTTSAAALALVGTAGVAARNAANASAAEADALRASALSATNERRALEFAARANRERLNAIKAEEVAREASVKVQIAAEAERLQRAEAIRQRDVAISATRVAEDQRRYAEQQVIEVGRQRSLAIAQLAQNAVDRGDAMTGILLARTQLQPGEEARWTGAAQVALRNAIAANRELATLNSRRNGRFNSSTLHAAISPDNNIIVAGSSNGSIKMWDRASGVTGVDLEPQEGSVHFLQFSSDGHELITVSRNDQVEIPPTGGTIDAELPSGSVRLWTISEDKIRWRDLGSVPQGYHSAAISADGRSVVAGSADGEVTLWTALEDQAAPLVLGTHADAVTAIAISPDGRIVASGSSDGTATVWWHTGGVARSLPLAGHTGPITSVSFSPDGNRVVTTSADTTARIWDLQGDLAHPQILSGHDAAVLHAAFSANGTHLVTASQDTTARVWDLLADAPSSILLSGHSAAVVRAQFSPDGERVVTAARDGTARLWTSIESRPTSIVLGGHTDALTHAAFSTDGRQIVTASEDQTVRLWNAQLPNLGEGIIGQFDSRIVSVQMNTEGSEAITISGSGEARVWQIGNGGAPSILLSAPGEQIPDAIFNSRLSQIVTSSVQGRVISIWEKTGSHYARHNIGSHNTYVNILRLSPDGRTLVTGSIDGLVQMWDLTNLSHSSIILEPADGGMRHVTFSPDGKRIAVSRSDGKVHLWDMAAPNGGYIELTGHSGQINRAVFSEDGRLLVTAARDSTAIVWRVDEPVPSHVILRGHAGEVYDAAIDPTGSRVATTSFDGTVRIWTVARDRVSSIELWGTVYGYRNIAFRDNGRFIVATSGCCNVGMWDTSQIQPARMHLGESDIVEFMSDEDLQSILTSHTDGTIRLWQRDESRFSSSIVTHIRSWPRAMSSSADHRHVIIGYSNGDLVLTNLEPVDVLVARGQALVTRCLSEQQMAVFGIDLVATSVNDARCAEALSAAAPTQASPQIHR